MRVFIMPGHTLSGAGTGAVGHINEGEQNRVLTEKIVYWLKQGGADVVTNKLDKANTSSYLAEQVALCNNLPKFDLVVQIHFNAGSSDRDSNTTGTETWYYNDTGKVYADRVNQKLGSHFRVRGSKQSTGLYWLKHTRDTAILIETCFVDDKDDVNVYNANKDCIGKDIAEAILGKNIETPTPPESKIFYRVVSGSYNDRNNADKTVQELKDKGYDAFIDIYKK